MLKILLYTVLFLYLSGSQHCVCLRRVMSREAKGFYDTRYPMSNDFLYAKKDGSKDKDDVGKDVESNQIAWTPGSSAATEGPAVERQGDKNFWLTEFGETDKIITVRVSSSVARSAGYYTGKSKAEPTGFDFREPVSQELWLQQTTETPTGNQETRIEAMSSRKEIVFGRPETPQQTTPSYEYYLEPREEFCCRLPEVTDGGTPAKLGYVMDGRNFRKYRVEERTPDGFIVGEYGFVRHEDGNLHGVRYTADVTANPRLIYDALVKFLSL